MMNSYNYVEPNQITQNTPIYPGSTEELYIKKIAYYIQLNMLPIFFMEIFLTYIFYKTSNC